MSRTAFSLWDGRIAPVFDTADRVFILEKNGAGSEHVLSTPQPQLKVLALAALDVKGLVCGAISREIQDMLTAQGIDIVSFVTGDLGLVVKAWQAKTLDRRFSMPGCQFRGQRAYRNGQGRVSGGRRGMPLFCVCPACGFREAHAPGRPCQQARCPHCGRTLIRES